MAVPLYSALAAYNLAVALQIGSILHCNKLNGITVSGLEFPICELELGVFTRVLTHANTERLCFRAIVQRVRCSAITGAIHSSDRAAGDGDGLHLAAPRIRGSIITLGTATNTRGVFTAGCSHSTTGNSDIAARATTSHSICSGTTAANASGVITALCRHCAVGNSNAAAFCAVTHIVAATAANTSTIAFRDCSNITAGNGYIGRRIGATTNTGTAARGFDCTTANDNMLFPAVTVRTADGCTSTALIS